MIRKILIALTLGLATQAALAAEAININSADAERLANGLDGVGEVRAQAIVDYRQANGGFSSVSSLTEVDGIGEVTLNNNRDRVTVGEAE